MALNLKTTIKTHQTKKYDTQIYRNKFNDFNARNKFLYARP